GTLDSFSDDVSHIVGVNERTKDQVKRIIDPFLRPGTTIAAAFREAILALFEEVDLLVADAADPMVKEGSTAVLERALMEAAAHEEALRDRSEKIQAADYATQVAVMEGATNVFLRTDGGRERLYRRGDGFG